MRVTEVQVEAAVTFPHPVVPYANVRPAVRLTATVDDDDDADEVYTVLMLRANVYVQRSIEKLLEIR